MENQDQNRTDNPFTDNSFVNNPLPESAETTMEHPAAEPLTKDIAGQSEAASEELQKMEEKKTALPYGTWPVHDAEPAPNQAPGPAPVYGASPAPNQAPVYGANPAPNQAPGPVPVYGANPAPVYGTAPETVSPGAQAVRDAAMTKKKILNAHELRLKSDFGRLGGFALMLGILAAFCFYKNANAVTYPLFIAVLYLSIFRIMPVLGFTVKKDSWFLAAAALVLAANSCATANSTVHFLNHIAQLLLGSIMLLHQCYSDREWNIEKYLSSIAGLWFQAIASLPLPFSYTTTLLKKVKSGKNRNILMILGGMLAAVPAVIYLGYLLADADAVFQHLIVEVILDIFNLSTIFSVGLLIIFSTLTACCLMGSVCSLSITRLKAPRQHNPLAAISFTAMITLLYLLFCGIQVIYLFAGKGRLPEGVTYSEYAREGFFQLLAVVVLNLVFVLNCFKYFRKHRALTFLLTVISLCTYVMIASAVYRMLLYVDVYYLTFLRLFVLWFLGLLSVLMLGVLAIIFFPRFPLFRWCLVSITIAWCGFAWCFPDAQIARYNIAREGGRITMDNAEYLTEELSADAAFVIAQAEVSPEVTYHSLYYFDSLASDNPSFHHPASAYDPVDKVILISSLNGIPWNSQRLDAYRLSSGEDQIERQLERARNWTPGIRSYNISEARAKEAAALFLKP